MDRDVAAVDAALDMRALVAACQEVVRIPSLSCQEAAVADVFVRHLKKLQLEESGTDENGNVIAFLRGQGDGRSLMVNGHIDHVPEGDMPDAHSGDLVDAAGWDEQGLAIFGRGSCDMKCNVMASAYALGAIRRSSVPLAGDVIFVADVQEEIDSPAGVKSVIERGIRADYGLSTESTNCRAYIGHRGKLEFTVEVRGRTAHASEPANGLNAILETRPVLDGLEYLARTLPTDPLFGSATITVTSLRSSPDNDTALIPDRCLMRIDRRYVRDETPETCEAELRDLLHRIAINRPDFQAGLRLTNHCPLMQTDSNNPIVEAAQSAIAELEGHAPALGAWRFGVNGTFMTAAGIPTVGIGPGDERWAHTKEEHVLIRDLERAARIWTRLILRVCGAAS